MNRVLVPTGFARPALPRVATVQILHGATMGTRWMVRHAGQTDPGRLRDGIEARLEEVVAQMSGWRAGSDLCRFNRRPAGRWQALPPAFREVLGAALGVAAATGGAFDPTIGPPVDLWGFGPEPVAETGPPSPARIAAAHARAGWQRSEFDAAAGRARQPGGLGLDLSGIAKGHAVDLLAGEVEAARVESYLVEIGGELRGRGVKPDGTPWWVAIERPGEAPSPGQVIVALHERAIATSGDWRRGFRHGGRSYGHTLDPRTGWPIGPDVAAVTVLHRRCLLADALATALAVMGLAAGLEHATRHGIAALMLARDAAGRLHEHLSPAMAAMLD